MTKICSKCGIEKDLEQFNKQKQGKSGRRATCRECQKKENAEYRHSEHGKKKRNDWRKTEKGRECEARYKNSPKTKEKMHTYHISEEYKAQRCIRVDKERFGGNRLNALKRDSYKCVICGSTNKIQVHHKDELGRNKPKGIQNHSINNLITLCAKCHIKQHNPVLVRWGLKGVV